MVKIFGELIDWYCDNLGKLGISPTDQKTKRSAFIAMQPLRKMVLTESYVRSREKLDGMAVREWRISMQERGLANGTICRYLSAGSLVIKTAWREKGWKLPNPFEDQTWGLTQKPRKRILTDTEEAKMLLALPQPYKDIAALILGTGLRDGEVLRLDWERVVWTPDGFISGRDAGRLMADPNQEGKSRRLAHPSSLGGRPAPVSPQRTDQARPALGASTRGTAAHHPPAARPRGHPARKPGTVR